MFLDFGQKWLILHDCSERKNKNKKQKQKQNKTNKQTKTTTTNKQTKTKQNKANKTKKKNLPKWKIWVGRTNMPFTTTSFGAKWFRLKLFIVSRIKIFKKALKSHHQSEADGFHFSSAS